MRVQRDRGSIAGLAFIAVVPLAAAIGGFAVDCMHVNDAKGELQRATDAAALAGAEGLGDYNTANGNLANQASTKSNSNQPPVNYALTVAMLNAVDGPRPLWDNTTDRTINASLAYDSSLYVDPSPNPTPNSCTVTGQVKLRSLFAQIFGNYGQTVNTRSKAGLLKLSSINHFAPFLVSYKDKDVGNHALEELNYGDTFVIELKSIGQTISNGMWLFQNLSPQGKNAQLLNSFINGTTPPPTDDISIGQTLGVAGDGYLTNGQGSLGQDFSGLVGKTLPLIITDDSYAPDNTLANGTPVHTVTRYAALLVTAVKDTPGKSGNSNAGGNGGGNGNANNTTGYQITGRIVPLITTGQTTGGTVDKPQFTAFAVRLVE